jgi:hypothetical protein
MCCCDKIFVNVAAYVIPGQVCVCVVQSKQMLIFCPEFLLLFFDE